MADSPEEYLKFLLSVDPDDEALKKAIDQINKGIESAKVAKVKLELEQTIERMWAPPKDVLPLSFWEERFGRAGEALDNEFKRAADTLKDIRIGMDPAVLRQRVSNEREITAARGNLEQAEHSERVKQAGGPMGYLLEQLKEGMGGKGGTGALLGGILGGQGGGGMLGQLGGMAGEALGGPVGAVVGEAIAKVIPEKIAQPAKIATTAMASVQKGLEGLHGSLGPVGTGLGLVSDGLGAISSGVKSIPVIGEVLGPMLDQLALIPKVFTSILETGISLVSKLSPGTMKQLNVALEDAQATIGQAFLPVVKEMIPYIRELGLTIAQALPSDQDMAVMFRDVFESIKGLVQDTAPLIGPVFKSMVVGTEILISALDGLVRAFNFTAKVVNDVVKVLTFGAVDLGEILGTSRAGGERQGATAARQASLGSIEEYQRRLQLETFQGGRDTGMQSLPQSVSGIRTLIENINVQFNKLMEPQFLISAIATGVSGLAGNAARSIVEKAEQAVNDPVAFAIIRGISPAAGAALQLLKK